MKSTHSRIYHCPSCQQRGGETTDNARLYPQVAGVARCFLSAPATSVSSEQLFSASRVVYTDRRNRLLPERIEISVVTVLDRQNSVGFGRYYGKKPRFQFRF